MRIPYRTRRALRRLGVGLLVLLVIAVAVWMCWVIWLERFVVYSEDGAKLDFSLSDDGSGGVVAQPPERETVSIYYNEGSDMVDVSTELTQLAGYYADSTALMNSVGNVRTQIQNLPAETPVMLDVKHQKGYFYYSTAVGMTTYDSKLNISEMDQLIEDLAKSKHYLIARIPALRDWEFGLNNVPCGLYLPSKRGLWMDEGRCYWLSPKASGTLTYLIEIITELRELGFDEVVLDEFRFPEGNKYIFSGDKSEALTSAAATLVTACATDTFCVSFVQANTAFDVPEGRCRVYLKDVSAADAQSKAEGFAMEDAPIRVVFLSESNDTRYEKYGVLRPLDTAH